MGGSMAESALVPWIRETLRRRPQDVPAFPTVAARLVGLLESPEVEMADVERLLAQDGAIAASVIRAANSALYRGVVPVDTLSRAVTRLGLRESGRIALAAAARSLYDVEDRVERETFAGLWDAVWRDALVCAFGAQLLCRDLKLGDPERVFLGAMFRNVGSLLVLKVVARAVVRGRLSGHVRAEAVVGAMDTLHVPLGVDYLRRSHLPEYVVAAAELHHRPALPFDRAHTELHVIRLADGLCQRIGVSPMARGELGPAAEQSLGALQVEPERLEVMELQIQELAEQAAELV